MSISYSVSYLLQAQGGIVFLEEYLLLSILRSSMNDIINNVWQHIINNVLLNMSELQAGGTALSEASVLCTCMHVLLSY
jgi:hypothetical protein